MCVMCVGCRSNQTWDHFPAHVQPRARLVAEDYQMSTEITPRELAAVPGPVAGCSQLGHGIHAPLTGPEGCKSQG